MDSNSFRDTGPATLQDPAGLGIAPVLRAPLDIALARLRDGEVEAGMLTLVEGLCTARRATGPNWLGWVASELQRHPVRAQALRCPFTRHAAEQPRGYAGDAELIDHIYGTLAVPPVLDDEFTRRIHAWTLASPAPRAVRDRRERLARLIDETALQHASPRGLAIAAGHLREWRLSKAAQAGALHGFVALDQDALSVDVMQRELGGQGVQAVQGTVRELISGRRAYDDLHLVYAAGLFDYLIDSTARCLVQVMHDALAIGGRMLIANFMPGIRDVGYMEGVMEWQLIYRCAPEVTALFAGLPAASRATLKIDTDPDCNIVYATLTRMA